jgi:hypothetical protein
VTERYGPELFPASKFLQVQPEARQPLMDALSGRPVYSVQTLQMHQTDPGMSAPFYDLSLYDDADFVITSSAVRSRYERDPERFSRHIRFYRRLEGTFDRVKVFRGPDGSGPVLTLYHNAPRRIPFGNRRTVSGPPRLDLGPGSGRERLSEFYYRMGLNYEVFSFTEEAMQSYDLALEYPAPPAMTAMLIFRKTGCLSRLGRGHEIPAFLQQMIATTRNESVRSFCRRLLVQSR